MIGGLLKSTSSLAIVAAAGMFIGGLALTPAMAADLGGDCCADLEERVADLEATTARKGNRKVSLKISGWVARDIGWIDDGEGQNEFYAAGHGPSRSRIWFTGSAKMSANWTAGYKLRFRAAGGLTGDIVEAGSDSTGKTTNVDQNYVYLKNAQLGTIITGFTYGPTDGVANIALTGRTGSNSQGHNGWNNATLIGISTFDLEQGSSENLISYVSPTLAGFTLAVAWIDKDDDATDNSGVDYWDAALRYANEFGPIRIAAGIGYTTTDDDTNEGGATVDGANVMGSVALMHTPTGLNAAFAAGTEIDGGVNTLAADVNDKQFWHVQGGINQNFFGVGKTSLYGEYGQYDDDDAATTGDTVMWGLGLVQNFDSAATTLWIEYRNWEDDDITDGDVQQILAGMRVKF